MIKVFLLLLWLLTSPLLFADQNSVEKNLLKSWGFQFTAQGKLVFNAGNQLGIDYKPWSPEFSGFIEQGPVKNTQKIIDPLVISSKDKSGQ